MRLSGCLMAAVLLGAAPLAHAQISYVSRESTISYEEKDVDLLTGQTTFEASDGVGTATLADFNQALVFPVNGTLWSDTSVGQFSRLFSDAVEFDSRALAEEDRTDNAFGVYGAVATSFLRVVFDLAAPTSFTITGETISGSASNKPGTTSLSFFGPSVNINTDLATGTIDFAGTLDPGRYTYAAFVESVGVYDDGFGGLQRTRGEDLGFNALLLLGGSAAIAGDYNDSGQVEQGDLDLVLQNWGVNVDVAGVPAGWTGPQPAGQIEQTELDGVLQNWGNTAAPDFSGSAVPEPVSALALLALTATRRRRF